MTDATLATATCVSCGLPLQLRSHESIQVLACPSGHGIFIHTDSLQVAMRDRTDDRPEAEEASAEQAQRSYAIEELEDAEGTRPCPTCGVTMHKRVFAYESGVPIDVCDEHGVWLDEGELHRIEAWYEAQERHRERDRAEWGGKHGKLEQMEQQFERQRADDMGAMHWGPVGWIVRNVSYAWNRKDDM